MRIKKLLTEKKIELSAFIVSIVCGIVILVVLNLPNSVGLANNGDYPRAIYPSGVKFIDGISYNFQVYVPKFQMALPANSNFIKNLYFVLQSDYSRYDYISSQEVVIKASKVLNLVFNRITGRPAENYNLIWLGLVYTVMFCAAAYFILWFIYRRFGLPLFIASAIICLFVFCDQGYTLYYNSFYGEPLQFTGTMLTIALFLRLWEKRATAGIWSYIIYCASVLLMAMSKNAYVPIGILFALLPIVFMIIDKTAKVEKTGITAENLVVTRASHPTKAAVISVSAVSIVVMLCYFFYMIPSWIEKDTNFNSVFAGVLDFGHTPEQDLKDLGLDPSLAVLKGREMYQKNYPIDITSAQFQEQFYDKISKFKIMSFYLTHPSRFIDMLNYTAKYARYIRPYYIGNLLNPPVLDPSKQSYQSNRFSIYETIRVHLPVNKLWFTIMVFIFSLALCIYELVVRRKKNAVLVSLILVLWGSAVFNFVTPYMGNGVPGIAKHMFGFIYFYDLLIFVLLGYAIIKIAHYVKLHAAHIKAQERK
ncbi:MAG: hypothetical protein FWD71_12530 [Oscillospiraceae bacterium]|nr:hypothetical protein [Oscillospiraceae bacterium]